MKKNFIGNEKAVFFRGGRDGHGGSRSFEGGDIGKLMASLRQLGVGVPGHLVSWRALQAIGYNQS